MYEILTRTSRTLHQVCEDYLTKFGVAQSDLYHVLRSLNWFEEAEAETPLPRGLTRTKWSQVRAWFEQETPKELKRRAE